MRTILALTMAGVPPLGACAADAQSTSVRSVGTFDRIELTGAFIATIAANAPVQRVQVRGDADTLAHVTTEVRDGVLVVGIHDGDITSGNISLEIAVPHLRSFHNSGAGSATITGLHDDIAMENSGQASIRAEGMVRNESITMSGVGKIDTNALRAHDVTARLSGAGSIHVYGDGRMELTVSGIGDIRYAGHPTHVMRHTSGLGSIAPA